MGILTHVLPIAALPVAWWVFWFSAALALYFGLVWVLIRLATAVDATHEDSPDLDPSDRKGEHSP